MEKRDRLLSMGLHRVRHDWATSLFTLRALSTTEQQRHLSSAFMEIESFAAIAIDFQQPPREFRVKRGTLYSRESGGAGL